MLQQDRTIETPGTMKLVTRGRRSGLPHVVELRFVSRDSGFYVVGRGRSADWVLNALASRAVKVRIGEMSIPCLAHRASEEESEWAIREFRRRFGGRLVDQWYAGERTCVFLERAGPAERRGAVRGESQTLVDYEEWRSRGRQYYAEVAAAFDSASEEYDFTISRNFINTWIRKRSLEILSKYLRRDCVAVEIGCGTGAETLEVAGSVRRVVATDISEKMISLVSAKVAARGIGNVIPLGIGARDVERVAPHLDDGLASVVYSLNGALNCEPELDRFVRGLEKVLSPGGHFVCSVRNTICLPEAVLHALALQFDRALPRLKQPTMVSVGGMDIPSTYYAPSAFANHFEGSFRVTKMIGLPAILPPAYLSGHYIRLGRAHYPIQAVEKILAGIPPFNRFGDQTLFVFQRRS